MVSSLLAHLQRPYYQGLLRRGDALGRSTEELESGTGHKARPTDRSQAPACRVLVQSYSENDCMEPMAEGMSPDEWPQAMSDDGGFWDLMASRDGRNPLFVGAQQA